MTEIAERKAGHEEVDGSSYMQILRSTAVIGGSSLVNVAFSVIRMKTIAVLLGPGGVGLISLYMSIVDLSQTVAGLGIQSSGVRQIAEAKGEGGDARVQRVAGVLLRVSLILAIGGALFLAALSIPVSVITFGSDGHAANIVVLSGCVFFGLLSSGQLALLQGLRRVADLARVSMLSAFFSAAITIPVIYLMAEDGIVPSLVCSAAASFGVAFWYRTKAGGGPGHMSPGSVAAEVGDLLRLGVVFMASGLLTVGAAYSIRLIVLKADGVNGAGLYQAAWALGGLYAGFILQAMGTDFYPRLTAAAHDNVRCNRLVNEQAHISILLAGPGLLATLTIAPLLMTVFYSSEFGAAADLLRLLCIGMMLRVIAWPVGFIVLAKGARKIFFWTEVAATVVHVGLAWMLVERMGVTGAGAAFVGLYLWHAALIYRVANSLSGFRWAPRPLLQGLAYLAAATASFVSFQVLPTTDAILLGLGMAAVGGLYSLSELWKILPFRR